MSISIRPLPCKDGTDVVHLTADELTDNTTDLYERPDQLLSQDSRSSMTGKILTEQTKLQYHVRVLPFISGQVLDSVDKRYLTPALLQEVGRTIGSVNKELKVRFYTRFFYIDITILFSQDNFALMSKKILTGT